MTIVEIRRDLEQRLVILNAERELVLAALKAMDKAPKL